MCHSCLKLVIKEFSHILVASQYLNQRWRPTGNTAGILAPVKVNVKRLRCMILSNDTKHA